MSDRVTIKSIARDLGVSHMTVSRALSGQPNVQKETRDAILKRASELGYVKSAAAQAMRGGGSGVVGLLLPNIVNEFYARFANSMARACSAQSLQLIIHLTDDDIAAEEQALLQLRQIQAQAVVMVPAPGRTRGDAARAQAMPLIQLIRRRDDLPPGPAITVEDSAAIRDAVLHLAAGGHRWVAYVGADPALSSGRARLAAFRDGLARAGLAEDPELVLVAAPSFEFGRESVGRILDGARATALVCGGFEISNGALGALMDAGIGTAGRFGFVGYGDPTFYAWVEGGVSTVGLPVNRLAAKAVELLTAPPGNANPQTHRFTAELVLRGRG